MKKYVKPELFYERYELTEQIAACVWDLNQAQGSCGYGGGEGSGYTDWVIIEGEIAGCELKLDPVQGSQIYCYYPQESGKSTFVS